MKRDESVLLPSLFEGFFAKQSVPVEWDTVFNVLLGGTLQEQTGRYRATKDWKYKSSLPSLTPACAMNGQGKEAADIEGLTGVSMADFDGIPPAALEVVRTAVNADPHTLLSYVTVSGEGLRVLFRYEAGNKEGGGVESFPAVPGLTPEEKLLYGKAFLQGNCYYADLIGYGFDEKCANVNRLSALCHDPEAFYNREAVPFRVGDGNSFSQDVCTGASTCHVTGMGDSSRSSVGSVLPVQACGVGTSVLGSSAGSSLSLTAYAAGVVERRGDRYVKGNRNQYLMKCLMMMNKLGVPQTEAEGWALAHDLGEAEIRRIVRSCYAHVAEHGVYEKPGNRGRSFPAPETAGRGVHVADVANVAAGFSLTHTCAREEDKPIPLPPPPLFPACEWPHFLARIVDCGETAAQRDALLLGAITVLGASLNRRVRFLYGRKFVYPCLQTFVVAPPASGKGALAWVRKLVEPMHNRMMGEYYRAMEAYRQEKLVFEQAGRARAGMKVPEQPPMKMFLIAGNNSATGVLENLMDAGGVGLICESEADTVSAAIGTDYGHWSDTLRKAFDHDRLSYNRRTNREYREIPHTFLSVLLSGTPAQVKPLIPSAENGLFSRQLFYSMPATTGWVDQFGSAEERDDLDRRFEAWGKEWEQCLQELVPRVSVLTFVPTASQQERFNRMFSCLFDTACVTQNGSMRSTVTRLAVNILRLMSVVAFLRAIEEKEGFRPAADIPRENVADGTATRFTYSITEADFEAVLSLARPLYLHAAYTLALLPEAEVQPRKAKVADLLLAHLGEEFTSSQAREAASAMGIPENTLRSHLHRLTQEGILRRTDRGCYRFTRTRV